VLRTVTSGLVARHAHVVGRRGGRTIGGTYARVVLRSTPAQPNTGVANRVSLHLVDGHLGGMTVDKLNEATTLARRDLDVCYLAKTLEEGSELVLGDIAGKPTHEDSRVVRIRELVHLSGWVEAAGIRETSGHLTPHLLLRHAAATHHWAATVMVAMSKSMVTAVLRGGHGDAHGTVAAVDTLHLDEGTLLVILIGKANESVATALTGHGIGHDLSRLAGREARLEQRNQDVFIDLGAKIANENAVLGTAVVTSIDQTTARCPVKLELTSAVGNLGTVEAESLGGGVRVGEFNETVSSVSRVLVANDLNVDRVSGGRQEHALNEVLVHPRLKFAHPKGCLGGLLSRSRWRSSRPHVGSWGGAVRESHLAGGRTAIGREGSVEFHAEQ